MHLTVPVLLALLFSLLFNSDGCDLASEIKSEPLDQSDGSDYTRNCEPWYSVFSLSFCFITSFFFTTFSLSFYHFFTIYALCFYSSFLLILPLKIIKNIFYFLLLVFLFLFIYLVVIFTILFTYYPHLMHYFISCHFIFFIIS